MPVFIYIKSRINSFKFAFKGLRLLWREANFRIHCIVFILVLAVSFYLEITKVEWMFVLLSSTLVFVSEAINTAVEKTLDFIKTEQDKRIEVIKDISAGFVLIAAINAVVVGVIVFLPKLLLFFQ